MKKAIAAGYIWPGRYTEGQSVYEPWYAQEYPQEVIDSPDDEVILEPNKNYTLVIDYPLDNPAKFNVETGKNGMTRREFANFSTQAYRKVYESPEVYGIWGHEIYDLTIHTLYIDENTITLGVDS